MSNSKQNAAIGLGEVEIEHFKSIRNISLQTKRINLLIGKANTGKSNILEAISVLQKGSVSQFGDKGIRFDKLIDLFNNKDRGKYFSIKSSTNGITLRTVGKFDSSTRKYVFNFFAQQATGVKYFKDIYYRESGEWDGAEEPVNIQIDLPVICYYKFDGIKEPTEINFSPDFGGRLHPYNGRNITYIIQSTKLVRDRIETYFDGSDLELLIDSDTNMAHPIKRFGKSYFKINFDLLADTLQQQIFNFAAIESNRNSVLLFEEPELHSYPPYIKTLAEDIAQSKTNQFFIATHSPYLLETLYENAQDGELQVFAVDYQNHQTVVFPIDNDALGELIANRADVFFNLQNFTA